MSNPSCHYFMMMLLRLSTLLLLLPPSVADLRIMINYRDESFISDALKYAIENIIDANITSRNILSITVRDSGILEEIQNNANVKYAERDNIMAPLIQGKLRERKFLDGDGEIQPYGISMVQADQIWDIPEVQDDLLVCVVDTGMFMGHPDLPTRLEDDVTGTNTGSGIWFQDGNGHGTHTAGTIGAIGSNSIGVVGVRNNPSVFRFHIGKGLSNEGSGFESDIMQAVQGCVDNGARVVSMSLGGAGDSKTAKEFYKDMYDQGVLLIAAAGNDGNTGAMYPASYKYVMSVAAVDRNETRPDFSQCNINVEIAGPGVDVLSTIPDGRYAIASGTSMACPHVAGVAAEIWARFPDCTNNQIRNVLLRSAKPLGEYGCANTLGSGLVQSKDAFDLLEAEGCEAGGAVDDVLSDGAVGGCEQNPDFVVEDNPYFGQCPSAAPVSLLSGFVLGFSTSLLLYFL